MRAETLRQLAGLPIAPEHLNPIIDQLTATVIEQHSWLLDPSGNDVEEPAVLRRRDGHSVYEVAGSATYSSSKP